MPELGGSYLLTLTVPGGDNTTGAAVTVTHAATGTVTSPVVSPDSDTSFSAVVEEIAAFGWYVATWTVTGTGANVKSSRFYVAPTPDGFGVWPPSLVDLRIDMGDRDDQDDSRDDRMSQVLDAAIDHVRDIKGWKYDIAAVEESGVVREPPTVSLILGTMRLAARWHQRRSTSDNLMTLGDAGGMVVPGYDSDIERLLQIGRFQPMSEAFA